MALKQLMHAASWMNLEMIMLSKGSQTKIEYILYDSIYIKSQKIQVNFIASYNSCQWLPGMEEGDSRDIGEILQRTTSKLLDLMDLFLILIVEIVL